MWVGGSAGAGQGLKQPPAPLGGVTKQWPGVCPCAPLYPAPYDFRAPSPPCHPQFCAPPQVGWDETAVGASGKVFAGVGVGVEAENKTSIGDWFSAKGTARLSYGPQVGAAAGMYLDRQGCEVNWSGNGALAATFGGNFNVDVSFNPCKAVMSVVETGAMTIDEVSGGWAGLRLKGKGGDRGNSRAVVQRPQGMWKRLGGGRLLAVGNVVGAGVGVWECLLG